MSCDMNLLPIYFFTFLLAKKAPLTEMCVVKVRPIRLRNRCRRNQKPLNYEIETEDLPGVRQSLRG